jgi:hypothetical protein
VHHRERGLPLYQPHKLSELRKIAHERGLNISEEEESNEKILRAKLEYDDRRFVPTFDRFTELPPELRVRIYRHYFEWLYTLPSKFNQLPICRASRLLRQESLPLFFGHYRFQIDLRGLYYPSGNDVSLSQCNLRQGTRLAAHCLSQELFARINHLQIVCEDVVWRADILAGTLELSRVGQYRTLAACGQATDQLRSVIDSISARKGGYKSRNEDILKRPAALKRVSLSG